MLTTYITGARSPEQALTNLAATPPPPWMTPLLLRWTTLKELP